MAGCSTSKFNRKIEIIEIRDDSLLRFSLDNGLLLSDLKREVKSAIEKKGMFLEVRVQHEAQRGTYCCELLKKTKSTEEAAFVSKWHDSLEKAELEVFDVAAQCFRLTDSKGLLITRSWCKSVLNTLISKFFKQVPPRYNPILNNEKDPNSGYYCEISHAELAMIHGASDFPVVHSNTFPKKQEAEQNAALHALAEWRYSIVLQGGDGNRSQSSGTDDTSDSD